MEYDIKRGWMRNIEGNLLPQMMKEVFGNVECRVDQFTSSYGIMAKIDVKIMSKETMSITVKNIPDIQTKYPETALDEAILDSKRKLNIFVERATGFDVKARKRRAQIKVGKCTP